MASQSTMSDEALVDALALYAGMVDKVVNDPDRWLGLDGGGTPGDGPGTVPARLLGAFRDRTMGTVTPASAAWVQLPLDRRIDWWVARVGLSAGLAAATPRVVGALADKVPLQAALGASGAGLAVCAVAREHGVTEPREWVPLLARVLLDRELATPAEEVFPPAQQSEDALAADDDQRGRLAALGLGAAVGVETLGRLALAFLAVQPLLDRRPRGGFLARALGKVPVVGVAGGWLDERGGIERAARETAQLLG
jgi:hypothetical protein